MNNFGSEGQFCGKRRQPFDDGDSEMMSSADHFGQNKLQMSSVFPGSKSINISRDTNQGILPAPKRVCNGVSSYQVTSQVTSMQQNLPTNQTMQQPYQEEICPAIGGDSKLFLDSPPPDSHSDFGAIETDSMETEQSGDAHHQEPLLGMGRVRFYNGALYNMGEIGQELRGVDVPQQYKGTPRVCIRCLAGEPGHITHILDCIS